MVWTMNWPVTATASPTKARTIVFLPLDIFSGSPPPVAILSAAITITKIATAAAAPNTIARTDSTVDELASTSGKLKSLPLGGSIA